jgi:SAM-dependent methyltransferase
VICDCSICSGESPITNRKSQIESHTAAGLLALLKRRFREGPLHALLSDLFYFLRDSTPERRRARFGDLDFDFDYHVDTTASNLAPATRLAGAAAGAGYQPTDPDLFRAMLGQLEIDFPRFTFVDLGSGKGRALLLASEYPFHRIVGVELLPELHRIALDNIAKYGAAAQTSLPIESLCLDAREFEFPLDPTVLYLFNPLPEAALASVLKRFSASLATHPREAYVLYANPILEHLLSTSLHWIRLAGNEQYALYRFQLL